MKFRIVKSEHKSKSAKKSLVFQIEKTNIIKKDLILSKEYHSQNLSNHLNENNNDNVNIKKLKDSSNSLTLKNPGIIIHNLNINSNNNNKETILNLISRNEKNQSNNINDKGSFDTINCNNFNISKFYRKKLTDKNTWSLEEDKKLIDLISLHGKKSWKAVSNYFQNKSRKQCFLRYRKFLSINFSKSNINGKKLRNSKNKSTTEAWTENEDEIIIRWVDFMGNKNWTKCSKLLQRRTSKECKNRWFNKLAYEKDVSEVNNSSDLWSRKEDFILLLFIRKFGSCYSKIAKFFGNKSGNQIKNKFYCIARIAFKNLNLNFYQNNNLENFQKTAEDKIYSNNNIFNINIDNNDGLTNDILNVKEKARKIISYLLGSKEELIYEQNLKIFKDAKRFFNSKLCEIYGKNLALKNCLSNLNMEDFKIKNIFEDNSEIKNNNPNQIFENPKKLNICSECFLHLRNHIKRKIIKKIKNSKINLETFRKFFFNNSQGKECNFQEPNKFSKITDGNFNFTFSSQENKIDILNKLPQIFDLIYGIKEKIELKIYN